MASLVVGHPEQTEYAPFYGRYVQLVTEEPVIALESQGRKTQALIAGLTDAQAGHRYAEGKWTVRDVVGHMADVEMQAFLEHLAGYFLRAAIAVGSIGKLAGAGERIRNEGAGRGCGQGVRRHQHNRRGLE